MDRKIEKCETVEELMGEILPELRKKRDLWSDEINELLKKRQITAPQLANACGVVEKTVRDWKKGSIPRRRETFIKVGLAVGFNKEEIDEMLKRYGYTSLYPKKVEDIICIYVLKTECSDDKIGIYNIIYEKANRWQEEWRCRTDWKVNTDMLYGMVLQAKNERELRRCVERNARVFEKAYQKVREYIRQEFVEIYKTDNVKSVADGQGWSASLRKRYSEISQDKWMPTRIIMISLGLHMAMSYKKLNSFLRMAYMDPLNSRNVEEAVLIYILHDAERNAVFKDRGEKYYDYDGLCIRAKLILEEMGDDMPQECKDLYREVEGIYVSDDELRCRKL